MSHYRPLLVGLVLLFSSLGLEQLGSDLQSLTVLIISFVFGVAGALLAIRGMVDFLGARLSR